jgi:hypothetical protein
MDGFDHILHWKLKAGSHRFPGQDGGTCINEAALVAAGFDYRPIRKADDMPACFSRPICRLAMWLNDNATDQERQRLLPFVTRLACADTPEVESRRVTYIRLRARRGVTSQKGLEILEGALAIGRQANALEFEDVKSRMDDVKSSADAVLRTVTKPTPPAKNDLFAKLRGWFRATKLPESVD